MSVACAARSRAMHLRDMTTHRGLVPKLSRAELAFKPTVVVVYAVDMLVQVSLPLEGMRANVTFELP
jgi:hypothetical protein